MITIILGHAFLLIQEILLIVVMRVRQIDLQSKPGIVSEYKYTNLRFSSLYLAQSCRGVACVRVDAKN